MKTIMSIAFFAAVLGVAPRECFALWDVMTVSREEAKELGLQVRWAASGKNNVSVMLVFKTEGQFKAFIPGGKFNDPQARDHIGHLGPGLRKERQPSPTHKSDQGRNWIAVRQYRHRTAGKIQEFTPVFDAKMAIHCRQQVLRSNRVEGWILRL